MNLNNFWVWNAIWIELIVSLAIGFIFMYGHEFSDNSRKSPSFAEWFSLFFKICAGSCCYDIYALLPFLHIYLSPWKFFESLNFLFNIFCLSFLLRLPNNSLYKHEIEIFSMPIIQIVHKEDILLWITNLLCVSRLSKNKITV